MKEEMMETRREIVVALTIVMVFMIFSVTSFAGTMTKKDNK